MKFKIAGQWMALYLLFICVSSQAETPQGWIIGVGSGYANTDWAYLISNEEFLSTSLPDKAIDGGAPLRGFVFRSLNAYWGVEASVEVLPTAKVHFSSNNSYPKIHGQDVWMSSYTQRGDLLLEFMAPFSHSRFYAFSDLGLNLTHREDLIANLWHWGPGFGAGLGYLTKGADFSVGFLYTTGFAKSETFPVNDYMPFAYDIYFDYGVKIA